MNPSNQCFFFFNFILFYEEYEQSESKVNIFFDKMSYSLDLSKKSTLYALYHLQPTLFNSFPFFYIWVLFGFDGQTKRK